jgi:hypothetical protein
MAVGTLEYRFPISYPYAGRNTLPVFAQRLHGAVFVDTVTLDGGIYNFRLKRYDNTSFGKPYLGAGFELKLDTTVAYHVPVQLIFGLYYGAHASANPSSVSPFISFGL